MFKKGFKFYMGMLTAGLAVSGGLIALMKFSTTVREWIIAKYTNFTRTIADRFIDSCENDKD